MYKMLVVDDFFFDVECVRDILDWSKLSIEIVGFSSNGLEALELISRDPPDIVLTDIEMPCMDGIELTQHIKQEYNEITVIFMSCYSDFEYARNAMELDVAAYITKPLIREDIHNVFTRICRDLKNKYEKKHQDELLKARLKESLPVLRERFLVNLLHGVKVDNNKIWQPMEYLNIDLGKGTYQLIVIEIDDSINPDIERTVESGHLTAFLIMDIVTETCEDFNKEIKTVVVRTDDIHIVLLLNYSREMALKDLKTPGADLAEDIRYRLDKLDMPFSTILAGDIFGELSFASVEYRRCVEAAKLKFFLGKKQLLCIKDLPYASGNLQIDLNQMKQEIREIVFSQDGGAEVLFVKNYLGQAIMDLSEDNVRNLTFSIVVCLQLLLSELNLHYSDIFGEETLIWKKLMKFETIADIRQWIVNILSESRKYVVGKSQSRNTKVIETVKKYIRDNMDKELTVQSIANKVYISANYLNSIFKNETGDSIPDYIGRERVEKAKSLLGDTGLKLYEIVEMVGYKHLPYFNSLFKKYTGLTPKQYRNNL